MLSIQELSNVSQASVSDSDKSLESNRGIKYKASQKRYKSLLSCVQRPHIKKDSGVEAAFSSDLDISSFKSSEYLRSRVIRRESDDST